MVPIMLSIAAKNEWRLFYLGSTAEVAATGAQVLIAKFPGLQLKAHDGHFDVQRHGAYNNEVLAEISNYQPHILFVGMGAPRQERWIQENRSDIEANVILTSGATLDYIAGAKRMAPRWMGAVGLEWTFRLATEPRRLASRYLLEPWGLLRAVVTNSLNVRCPAHKDRAKSELRRCPSRASSQAQVELSTEDSEANLHEQRYMAPAPDVRLNGALALPPLVVTTGQNGTIYVEQ